VEAIEEEEETAYVAELIDNLELFARDWLEIRTKSGEIKPLVFNDAQRMLHRKLEDQKRATGKVRALILKGRQQGCSTYVQARYYHRVSWLKGLRAFILTHEDEASKNIFEMAKRFYNRTPPSLTPHLQASNARELLFDEIDSGYRVSTAGTKDTGRSATFQLFHGSEVGYWPHAETHAAGAMQAVPDEDGSEIILESTSNGPRGLFYAMWQQAARGEGDYIAIFIPWFWQHEYRRDAAGFEPTSEEAAYMRKHDCDAEQMAWRRAKILELHGVWHFRREYPATPEEAFSAEVPGALWKRSLLNAMRIRPQDMPPLTRVAVSLDPATTSKKTSDEWGNIWGGKATNGHVYIVGDETDVLSPDEAAKRAIGVIQDQQGNEIVYESNQGGDMVPTIIRLICEAMKITPIRCVGVHASKAKRARAEPVHSLCVAGKVHIVGTIAALEDELCTWDAASDNESPNRLDAFVWLVTHFLIKGASRVAAPSEGTVQESRWG
jgi:phage terminase large subunit-like protein